MNVNRVLTYGEGLKLAAAVSLLLLNAGCRSRFVSATIQNDTNQLLRTVELDYPGAGFGVSTLAPHATYSYRFKAIGSGPLSLSYSEAGVAHTSAGPVVNDGQGGSVSVHIREGGSISWEPTLSSR